MTFYFTYGTSGHPFTGGWTEVEAPDMSTACRVFREKYPDEGLLRCAAVYSPFRFMETSMYKSGNLGYRCHERLKA